MRAALRGAAQQLAQARRGVALADLRCVGAEQRGERADLDGEVRARQRAGAVAFELRPRRLALVDRRKLVERLGAALGVAVGLRRGHGRLAEQVDGRRRP